MSSVERCPLFRVSFIERFHRTHLPCLISQGQVPQAPLKSHPVETVLVMELSMTCLMRSGASASRF